MIGIFARILVFQGRCKGSEVELKMKRHTFNLQLYGLALGNHIVSTPKVGLYEC